MKALPSLRKLVRKIKHEIDLDLVDVIDLISKARSGGEMPERFLFIY